MRTLAVALGPLLGAALVAAPAHAERPEGHYLLHCQGCHLADGSGKPGAVPALPGQMGRFLEVPGGREFLVRVPGSALSPLDDGELAALLNWMLQRFGPAEVVERFPPFAADEVARVRRPPLLDVATRRRQLLAQVPER